MEHNIILQIDDVCFAYPGDAPVLDNVNFTLREGEKVGLIGHNGCGKTTFLQIIMGLVPTSSGSITIFGQQMTTEKDFQKVRQKIGFLFQNADDQLFSPTVIEDVAFGPLNLGKTPREAKAMSKKVLTSLNLEGFEHRITGKLSGGEKKLVSLATILVMEPDILLLDEPSTGLDRETTDHIISILNRLDISYVIVSHEYDFLARTTRDIYSMVKGRIKYDGDVESLHTHYHKHPDGNAAHKHI